mmetsp:Transcript_26681/g.85642  ORF Transcript_26681/g.85642 Transcript_26681/m.85642 type:complete len:310 (+) Transcript_26681:2089-3018(+)
MPPSPALSHSPQRGARKIQQSGRVCCPGGMRRLRHQAATSRDARGTDWAWTKLGAGRGTLGQGSARHPLEELLPSPPPPDHPRGRAHREHVVREGLHHRRPRPHHGVAPDGHHVNHGGARGDPGPLPDLDRPAHRRPRPQRAVVFHDGIMIERSSMVEDAAHPHSCPRGDHRPGKHHAPRADLDPLGHRCARVHHQRQRQPGHDLLRLRRYLLAHKVVADRHHVPAQAVRGREGGELRQLAEHRRHAEHELPHRDGLVNDPHEFVAPLCADGCDYHAGVPAPPDDHDALLLGGIEGLAVPLPHGLRCED